MAPILRRLFRFRPSIQSRDSRPTVAQVLARAKAWAVKYDKINKRVEEHQKRIQMVIDFLRRIDEYNSTRIRSSNRVSDLPQADEKVYNDEQVHYEENDEETDEETDEESDEENDEETEEETEDERARA